MKVNFPPGVALYDLKMNQDSRGCLTEIYREEWFDREQPRQWNYVCSRPNTLRGLHVHLTHADYLVVLQGQGTFYLKDLRKNSPAFLAEAEVVISSEKLQALYIPPGVAHGFYFAEAAQYIYAVTHYWNKADELGFYFNSPDVGFKYPNLNPLLSEQDQKAPALTTLLTKLSSYDFKV